MSVLDFIKKPYQQSTASVPQVVNVQPVPQYVITTQTGPGVADIEPRVDPQEVARQAYIASLLNAQPKQVVQTAVPQPVTPVVAPVVVNGQAHPQAVVVGQVVDGKTVVAPVVPAPVVIAPVPPVKTAPSTFNLQPSTTAAPAEVSRQALLDLMTHMTSRANKCLVMAQNKSKEIPSDVVESEHLLHGLLADGEIYKLLVELKVAPATIETELRAVWKPVPTKLPPQLSTRVKKILEQSLMVARKVGQEFIAPEHILLALFEEGEGAGARILVKLGLTASDLTKKVVGEIAVKNQTQASPDGKPAHAGETKQTALAQYTTDITAKAEKGELDAVVERAEEIERVVHVLSRRTKNNPALVGEPGVGKTAIVEGLAQRIVDKQVPDVLLGKRILELDLMSVLAGASHQGDFEQRMKDIIEEVVAAAGKIIMFIDEMHTIVGAGGGGGSSDAANFLKPALARGDLQMIGATTITEYRKYVEKDPALERRFQMVMVPEPTEEAAIKMLKATRSKYENFHKVKIPDVAIEAAVKLSKRYVGDRFLPDKAIDLMDEAASAVRLPLMSLPEDIASLEARVAQLNQDKVQAEAKNDTVRAKVLTNKIAEVGPKLKGKKDEYAKKKSQSMVEVTEDIIKDVVSGWTGVPVSKLSNSETDRLTKLEDIMHERMIGQERPVKSVASAVRRGRAGLKSNQRPIGSFIFLGPSGVGKTELCKTLAEVLFGQEESMIRFDMTEFMEKHEVAKLLGPPPGYVGYEEGGKLTEAVRRKPYSVVLFDEVEKAHPDIFNILLQILDDGRLTDNKGRTISFKNTVVICTSNIGTQMIQDELLKKLGNSRRDPLAPAKESEQKEKEVIAGSQEEKRIKHLDDLTTEYTDMKAETVAPSYRGQPAHFDELELPAGYQYEDEVMADAMPADEYNKLKELVMGELRKFFRPELINRFDEVIVFEPLQLKHMKLIVRLQLKSLTKLLEEQNLGLTVTDVAEEQIVLAGFDPVYGARPLRRAIQKLLEDPMSEIIIAHKAVDGDIIIVDFVDDDFTFKIEKPHEIVKESDHEVTKAFDGRELTPQHYRCIDSGHEFHTLVYPGSVIICPVNVKEKVEQLKAKAKPPAPKEQPQVLPVQQAGASDKQDQKPNGAASIRHQASDIPTDTSSGAAMQQATA